MSTAMVIAAICIMLNLIINHNHYVNETTGIPLTITSFGVCVGGYALTVFSIGILIPILLFCKRLGWKCRRIIGKLCAGLLLFGLFGVQVRTYTEHWLYTLIGLILVVDIQVLSED